MKVNGMENRQIYDDPGKTVRDKKEESVNGADYKEKEKPDLTPRDEYIPKSREEEKPTGLYKLGRDENGNPKIIYDKPKKPEGSGEENPKEEEAKAEECTVNTDRVDQEIQKLKEQKKQLQQQIKASADDEKKVKSLEAKLAQIENSLLQKDNDAYRRQNSSVS